MTVRPADRQVPKARANAYLALTFALAMALGLFALPGCDASGSADRASDAGRTLMAGAGSAFAGVLASDSIIATTRHLPVDAADLNGSIAAISSDGRSLVATDWSTGEIVIRELRDGAQRTLFHNPAPFVPGFGIHPRITREQERVAYTWVPMAGNDNNEATELRVVELSEEGAEPRTLFASGTWVEALDWSPDGSEVVVTNAREDGTAQLVVVPLDGSEPRVLFSLGWNSPGMAAYSADGRWIAFDFASGEQSRNRDIQVIAADGSDGRMVVAGDSDDWLLGWSPEGSLLFVSDRGGTPGAWQLPMSNGRAAGSPELVKPDMWRISPLGMDRDGRLFYVHMEGGAGVHVASLDPATGRLVGAPSHVDPGAPGLTLHAAWSPDGRHLAYLAETRPFSGGADRIIVIRAIDSGEIREIRVPPPTQGLAGPRWTPDGRAILVRAQYDRGLTSLLRVDVQTGDVQRLLEDVDLYPTFELFPDGRRIVFADRLPAHEVQPAQEDGQPRGGQRLIVRDLDGSGEVELYRHVAITPNAHLAIWRVALSPDGSRVAFTRTHRASPSESAGDLVVMDIDDGKPVVVAELAVSRMTSLAWSTDGEHLLYALRATEQEMAASLWRVRPGSSPEELAHFADGLGGVRPHPDGRRIVLETGSVTSSLWVMENIAPVVRRAEAGGRR